jgi:hypothetical protein
MSETISRMYGTYEKAAQAAAELKSSGFEDVHLVSRNDGGKGTPKTTEAIVAAIVDAYVLRQHAKVYAEGVSKGGTLVTVHAPFGSAAQATEIVDGFDPIPTGLPEPERNYASWDEATPISCLFHVPVLLDESETFSKFWNVPPLITEELLFSGAIGVPLLMDGSSSFSSAFGVPTIVNGASPLSSLFHLPLLYKSSTAS